MTDYIFKVLNGEVDDKIDPQFQPNLAASEKRKKDVPLPAGGLWTHAEAKTRLAAFHRTVLRQLAHMASNRGRRTGERRGRAAKRGYLSEPGTRGSTGTKEDMMDYVVDQVRKTADVNKYER